MQKPVSPEAACAALPKLWSPRVVGRVNDQFVETEEAWVISVEVVTTRHTGEEQAALTRSLRSNFSLMTYSDPFPSVP